MQAAASPATSAGRRGRFARPLGSDGAAEDVGRGLGKAAGVELGGAKLGGATLGGAEEHAALEMATSRTKAGAYDDMGMPFRWKIVRRASA